MDHMSHSLIPLIVKYDETEIDLIVGDNSPAESIKKIDDYGRKCKMNSLIYGMNELEINKAIWIHNYSDQFILYKEFNGRIKAKKWFFLRKEIENIDVVFNLEELFVQIEKMLSKLDADSYIDVCGESDTRPVDVIIVHDKKAAFLKVNRSKKAYSEFEKYDCILLYECIIDSYSRIV